MNDFSPTEEGLIQYISKYCRGEKNKLLEQIVTNKKKFSLEFSSYDWDINFLE